MKKSKLFLTGMLATALMVSCAPEEPTNESFLDLLTEFQDASQPNVDTINVQDVYSMIVPTSLYATNELNDVASLQYNNPSAEEYIIVIHEDKQEFIDIFKELGEFDDTKPLIDFFSGLQYESFAENSNIYESSPTEKSKINGMPARHKKVVATVEGIEDKIVYYLAYIEGQDQMYTVMAWTLESYADSFEEKAEGMIHSIVELY